MLLTSSNYTTYVANILLCYLDMSYIVMYIPVLITMISYECTVGPDISGLYPRLDLLMFTCTHDNLVKMWYTATIVGFVHSSGLGNGKAEH